MMSSLDSQPENGGKPESARPADDEAQKRERQRLAKAAHAVQRLLPPMALMSEPAAMNSSALKNAWVMR